MGAASFTSPCRAVTSTKPWPRYDRLSFPDVAACGLCGSDNLDLTSRVAQGKYKYTSVKCLSCRADLTFGKNKDDDQSYFLRRKETGELDWRAFDKKPE